MRLILVNMGCLFGFSFVLHGFLLSIIRFGVFGLNLRSCLNNLLNKYINLIPFFSVIVFILLKLFFCFNTIFLDSKDIIVNANLENTSFIISGDVLKLIFENLGGAAVFGTGARIAAGLLAKHPMGVLPKIGVIGGTGAGYPILYRMSLGVSSITNSSATDAGSVSVKPVHIKLETVVNTTNHFDRNAANSLVNSLGLQNKAQLNRFSFTETSLKDSIFFQSNNHHGNSKILSALEQEEPN
jgi:hypothetical protein